MLSRASRSRGRRRRRCASLCRCSSRSLSRLDAPKRNRSGSSQLVAGDLVDHHQVADRVLGGADAAGQLDAAHARRSRRRSRAPPRSITSATGGVAAGLTLPVEVLMKSPPASSASHEARRTLSSVASSPVSRITLRCAVPQRRAFDRDDLVEDLRRSARRGTRRGRSPCRSRRRRRRRRRATSAACVASDARPGRERRRDRRDRAPPMPRSASTAISTRSRVDADGGDRRARRVARVGPHRLRAQRAHLAGRVRALERGQVDHADRHVERPRLARRLDAAGGEPGRPRLGADLVDAGQAVQEPPQRRVVARHVAQRIASPNGCSGSRSRTCSVFP